MASTPLHQRLQQPGWSLAIRVAAVLLAVMGTIAFIKGVAWGLWGYQASHDLKERHVEVLTFLDHHYPNPVLDPRALRPELKASVYLPYAFPLMVPLFPGGQLWAAQALVILLSLASLAVMARYGFRQLRFAGQPLGWFGAAAPLALNAIPPTLADMQFSLLCTGLVLVHSELLRRQRPLLAGVCWSLAMLKPQIALPFALLFLWRRQWSGLVLGGGLLAGLSLFSSVWTGIPALRILQSWLGGRTLAFTRGRLPLLPLNADLAERIDPTLLQLALIGSALALLTLLALRLAPRADRLDLVNLTGLCALVGALAFYHRNYDFVMLFPALIALLRLMVLQTSRWTPLIVAITLANGLLLWRPNNLASQLPLAPVQTLLWAAAAVVLAGHLLRANEELPPRCLAGSPPS